MGCVRVKAESVKDGAREMLLAMGAELNRTTSQEQLVGLYGANYYLLGGELQQFVNISLKPKNI